jgi:hypothetical protein
VPPPDKKKLKRHTVSNISHVINNFTCVTFREIPFCVKNVILKKVALKDLAKETKVYTKL